MPAGGEGVTQKGCPTEVLNCQDDAQFAFQGKRPISRAKNREMEETPSHPIAFPTVSSARAAGQSDKSPCRRQ